MAKNENNKVVKRIKTEIEKIDKKENTLYFFVLDTKGNPNENLEYIYKLAFLIKNKGYNVTMLYQEDEDFVGVGEWLGKEYAELPHENIMGEGTSVSPSDIVFIPEIFASVMTQTKNLPCKRVAILQNYDFITEQIPLSVQWGDLNIMEAIVNTEDNKRLLNNIFPYVKTTVINPYIDERVYDDNNPKKLIVNILSKDPSNINKIVKPFYWSYPLFKWVSFRDLRGFSKEEYGEKLREAAITIWVDDNAITGQDALEAMKSGSLVLAKIPSNNLDWVLNKDGSLFEGCLWFDSVRQLPNMIAQLVRSWITDKIPAEIVEKGKELANSYTKQRTEKEFDEYINNTLDDRKNKLEDLITAVKKQK